MNSLSYWEIKQWFQNVDFTIVGSGIVGLNCALRLRERFPNAKILILEKGFLPQGASTKNAGFACFGSLSELIDDLKSHSEEEVVDLVKRRWDGLELLRKNLGDRQIDFQKHKGFELFNDTALFEKCVSQKDAINELLFPVFNKNVFTENENTFGFQKIVPRYIVNDFEGQIDTGKMMSELLKKVREKGITIVNNISVEGFISKNNAVEIKTDKLTFTSKQLLIASNGFSKRLINEEVQPARAQVLITKPIKNLHIKGTFHLEEGYYYFRNIDNRILLGGGRNLDFKEEETMEFSTTELIQNKLEELLKTIILPDINVEIEHRWSGIMGVGNQKKSIVKPIDGNVFCGVRLGGMGVAIGSLVGKELADLV